MKILSAIIRLQLNKVPLTGMKWKRKKFHHVDSFCPIRFQQINGLSIIKEQIDY